MTYSDDKVMIGAHVDLDLKLKIIEIANKYHLSISKTTVLLLKRAINDLNNSPKGDLVND